jgi:hypothetical protein
MAPFLGRDRRRYPRTPTESLRSDLGVVLDLSPGGMRVLVADVPDGPLAITLLTADGQLALTGRVAWSRRQGLRSWELGLEFQDVDDALRERLVQVALDHQRAITEAG